MYKPLLSAANCTLCPTGRYQVAAGGTNCTGSCPAGSFADATGLSSASQCKQCVAGTFASASGSSACAPCPEGSYENVDGR